MSMGVDIGFLDAVLDYQLWIARFIKFTFILSFTDYG